MLEEGMICHTAVSFNVGFDRNDIFTLLLEYVHFPNSIIEWEFVFQVYNVESGNLLMMPLWIRPGIVPLSTAGNYTNFILIFAFFQENLRQYVDRIFTVITKSGVSCPTVMCDIFFSLRESAAKRFQGEFTYIFILHNW